MLHVLNVVRDCTIVIVIMLFINYLSQLNAYIAFVFFSKVLMNEDSNDFFRLFKSMYLIVIKSK